MARVVGSKPVVSVDDEVGRSVVTLLLKEPFYAHLLGGVVRRIDDCISTAAVSLTPQGLQLIVNPDFFIKKLRKEERVAVIKHEALHLLFRHLYRPLIKNGDAKLFNIAADIVVNQHVAPWPLPEMAVKLQDFPDMGLEADQTLEWYYQKLSKLQDDMARGGSGRSRAGSARQSPKSEEALQRAMSEPQQGDHGFWFAGGGEGFGPSGQAGATPLTEGLRQALEADLERHLIRARDHTGAKAWGSVPAGIRNELDAVAERRKPQIDWKRTLRLFASSGYRTQVVATNRRMSKRFGTFPGIRIQRRQRIAVLIDTSGSITLNVMTIFFSEVHGVWRNGAEVVVVECDAQVQRFYPYKGKMPDAVKGGGGTDFDPALQWVRQARNGPFDACIFLTDGCAGAPDTDPRCPLLWVVTADGSVGDHLKFGRTVKLPDAQPNTQ